jgi:hypothetical protein
MYRIVADVLIRSVVSATATYRRESVVSSTTTHCSVADILVRSVVSVTTTHRSVADVVVKSVSFSLNSWVFF